jgi:hypothetical protein
MIRFNTDSGHLEYYTGEFWDEVLVANNTLDGGNRGVIGARATPAFINNIDYFTISTSGNAQDFGNMSTARYLYGSFASSTRGVFTGGNGQTSRIESITFASTGSAIVDSGTLVLGRYFTTSCSNSTRGLTAGGAPGPTGALSSIESTTISSLGNAVLFGDLNEPLKQPTSYASSTRGLFAGGYNPSPTKTATNVIQYVTISTTGNTQDFGDLTRVCDSGSAVGSSTRAVFGSFSSPVQNNIDFITIASTGDAQDFGDMIGSGLTVGGSFSSVTRGCFAGGLPGNSNLVQSIQISTTGDAVDFGDLSTGGHGGHGCSNGHGGL